MSTEPNTGAEVGSTFTQVNDANKEIEDKKIATDDRVKKNVSLALEHAVERGKLQPYEAIEAADYFGVLLQPWVQRQHDHHVAHTGKRKA